VQRTDLKENMKEEDIGQCGDALAYVVSKLYLFYFIYYLQKNFLLLYII